MRHYVRQKWLSGLVTLLVFFLFSVNFHLLKSNLTLVEQCTTYFSIAIISLAVGGIVFWRLRIDLFKKMTEHMNDHVGSIDHVFNKARRFKVYKNIPMPEFYRKSKVLAYEFRGHKYNPSDAERYARAILCFMFLSKYDFDWKKIKRQPMYYECKKHYDEIKLFSYLMDKLYEERYGGY